MSGHSRAHTEFPIVYMMQREIDAMGSRRQWGLPTGTTPGRTWHTDRGAFFTWHGYYDGPNVPDGRIGIASFRVVIVDLEASRSKWLDTWDGSTPPPGQVWS